MAREVKTYSLGENRRHVDTAQLRTAGQLFAAYIEYMKLMLGNLFILNAGSATALIAFYGDHAPSNGTLLSVQSIREAVVVFAVGAMLAVIATLCMAIVENINSGKLDKAARDRVSKPPLSAGAGYGAALFILCSSASFSLACLIAIDAVPSWLAYLIPW